MRPNRTRVAVAALSATALVGLPVVLAAPAGATVTPAGVAPGAPYDITPEPAAQIELGVLPDPDPPADVVEGSDSVLADTALGPPVVEIERAITPVSDPLETTIDPDADAVSASEQQAPQQVDVPESPDGFGSPDGQDSSDESDRAPDGTDEVDSASAPDTADESTDATSDSSSAANSGAGNDSARTLADDSVTTQSAAVAGESSARVAPLADTGAAVGDLLRVGLALVVGGIAVAGAGRHRRPGPARVI